MTLLIGGICYNIEDEINMNVLIKKKKNITYQLRFNDKNKKS